MTRILRLAIVVYSLIGLAGAAVALAGFNYHTIGMAVIGVLGACWGAFGIGLTVGIFNASRPIVIVVVDNSSKSEPL